MALETPIFISEDAEIIISEMKAYYESLISRVLAPADVEMDLIGTWAYFEKRLRIAINNTGRQNLVAFAAGSMLDYLGQWVGVERLAATGAVCQLQFTFVSGHPAIQITDPVRVQSGDGKVIFITDDAITAPLGVDTVTVSATCTTTGATGNGYAVGEINIILDPQAYLAQAVNADIPAGGADDETDDALRTRIMLAPNSFSVAGPTKAYEYFAKSANQAIVDVAIDSLQPGEVDIYPLLAGGQMPNADVLAQVLAICNDTKVRPLSDTVFAFAPTKIDYAIEVELTLYSAALDDSVLSTVNSNLEAYKAAGLNLLGRDVMRAQLNKLCVLDGDVYNVNIVSPAADVIVAKNEFANCTGISVNITGHNDG